MSIVTLYASFPSSAWRRTFADELIRLLPDLNPDAADEAADHAYEANHQLDPADAAALHAGVPPAPPDPTAGETPIGPRTGRSGR